MHLSGARAPAGFFRTLRNRTLRSEPPGMGLRRFWKSPPVTAPLLENSRHQYDTHRRGTFVGTSTVVEIGASFFDEGGHAFGLVVEREIGLEQLPFDGEPLL